MIEGNGRGEISGVGVAAAVANAVFNTTGKRIRELPLTLDKMLLLNSLVKAGDSLIV